HRQRPIPAWRDDDRDCHPPIIGLHTLSPLARLIWLSCKFPRALQGGQTADDVLRLTHTKASTSRKTQKILLRNRQLRERYDMGKDRTNPLREWNCCAEGIFCGRQRSMAQVC